MDFLFRLTWVKKAGLSQLVLCFVLLASVSSGCVLSCFQRTPRK